MALHSWILRLSEVLPFHNYYYSLKNTTEVYDGLKKRHLIESIWINLFVFV